MWRVEVVGSVCNVCEGSGQPECVYCLSLSRTLWSTLRTKGCQIGAVQSYWDYRGTQQSSDDQQEFQANFSGLIISSDQKTRPDLPLLKCKP